MNEPKDYDEQEDIDDFSGVLLAIIMIGGLSFLLGLLVGMWVG